MSVVTFFIVLQQSGVEIAVFPGKQSYGRIKSAECKRPPPFISFCCMKNGLISQKLQDSVCAATPIDFDGIRMVILCVWCVMSHGAACNEILFNHQFHSATDHLEGKGKCISVVV